MCDERLPEELAKVVAAQFYQVLADAQFDRHELFFQDEKGHVVLYGINGFSAFAKRTSIFLEKNSLRHMPP